MKIWFCKKIVNPQILQALSACHQAGFDVTLGASWWCLCNGIGHMNSCTRHTSGSTSSNHLLGAQMVLWPLQPKAVLIVLLGLGDSSMLCGVSQNLELRPGSADCMHAAAAELFWLTRESSRHHFPQRRLHMLCLELRFSLLSCNKLSSAHVESLRLAICLHKPIMNLTGDSKHLLLHAYQRSLVLACRRKAEWKLTQGLSRRTVLLRLTRRSGSKLMCHLNGSLGQCSRCCLPLTCGSATFQIFRPGGRTFFL